MKPIRNAVPVANPPAEVQQAIDASNQRLLARIRAARQGAVTATAAASKPEAALSAQPRPGS